DSNSFAERERATQALARHGDRVEASLRRFLSSEPSLEARRRAGPQLARAQGPITDPDRLRALRALEGLELIGTPQACRVLERLGQGAPEDRLTRDAKTSRARLRKREIHP